MTREEIINQGRPIEPHCFDTDREEQWYNLGLYDGATANPWHSVADVDYPARVLDANGDEHYKSETVVVTDGKTWTIAMYDYDLHKWTTMLNVTHWMEIPRLPKKGSGE